VKKNDTLVAVGGGVTSDLVGFVATTYMRGIEFVFIPTTLMAMVDAANGGKNGINLDHGKNLVGTTSLPFEIIFDKIFLQTLSSEVYLEGFMEIIKYGLIFDKDFFLDLVKGQMAESKMIERSIQIKNQICSLDPEDFSTRRILNFGHTIGHGLEKMFDYEISHGKAIFFGMILEAHISFQKRYLALEELDFVKNYFLSVGKGFLSISNIDPNLLWSHMQFDKKNEFEKVRCVVLKRIGKCVTFSGNFCTYLSFNELANSLNWLKNKFLI
jgi:3-dehydroquinate synthase